MNQAKYEDQLATFSDNIKLGLMWLAVVLKIVSYVVGNKF